MLRLPSLHTRLPLWGNYFETAFFNSGVFPEDLGVFPEDLCVFPKDLGVFPK